MKKVLLILLVIVLALGVVGAAGFTGYRLGYAQGIQATANDEIPSLRFFDRNGPDRLLDRFGMDRGFERGFGMRGRPMLGSGGFSLLRVLTQIAVLALIVLLAYWLFTRSGWRLTRETAQPAQTTPTTESVPPSPENES